MTDLTEREKQIVAWLRRSEYKTTKQMKLIDRFLLVTLMAFWPAKAFALAHKYIADAIEAGEPWKDKNDG